MGHCILLARQQNGKHSFLDVEAVLRFVKDLVRVLLEQGGGDLLAPVGGQTVQHQRVGLCVFQQTAGELEAHKIPQTLLVLGSAGGGGVPRGGGYDVRVPQALGGVGGQVKALPYLWANISTSAAGR